MVNFVVIVIDALRTDRISAYGGRPVTPTIAEVAENGVKFGQAYTPINATDPAITSLHTGCYPKTHGIINHGAHITVSEKRAVENTEALPQILNQSGYDTAAFGRPLGRWHKRGFDRYPDIETHHWKVKSIEKKVSELLYQTHPKLGDVISQVYNQLIGKKSSDSEEDLKDKFSSFVAESDEFYAFVHLMDTHTPYEVDSDIVREYLERFDYENESLADLAQQFPPGSVTRNSLEPGGVINRENEKWEDSEVGVGTALIRAQYDAAATEADKRLSEILEVLREQGRFENTVLFILSDHGESLGEHGIYFEHHGLYEPTVKIPLVVHTPFSTTGRSSELVSIIDIAPTIYQLSDIYDVTTDGNSLYPLLRGEDDWRRRDSVLLEEANTQRYEGVRTERWKYLRAVDETTCRYCQVSHGHKQELYNLITDPKERDNIATERPRVVELLDQKLEMAREQYSSTTGEAQNVSYGDEEEVLERLESLGYR